MIARRLRVHGLVQGVGFRWATAAEARRLGVAGWVRNRADGTVEVYAEGEPDALDALAGWAQDGPRFADVSHVEVTDAQPTGSVGFEIED